MIFPSKLEIRQGNQTNMAGTYPVNGALWQGKIIERMGQFSIAMFDYWRQNAAAKAVHRDFDP